MVAAQACYWLMLFVKTKLKRIQVPSLSQALPSVWALENGHIEFLIDDFENELALNFKILL